MNAMTLPDDIEQFLINGERLRAIVVLAERRRISMQEASELVERWLFNRQQAREGGTDHR
jgi:hypothetical protein